MTAPPMLSGLSGFCPGCCPGSQHGHVYVVRVVRVPELSNTRACAHVREPTPNPDNPDNVVQHRITTRTATRTEPGQQPRTRTHHMNCDLHSLAWALLWMLATASLASVWTWAIANEHGRPDGARPGEQWP